MTARSRPDGIHLGLKQRLQADILWQGKGGMKWHEVKRKVKHLLTLAEAPDILVIHCGGNDLGLSSPKKLRERIISDLHMIKQVLPQTKIVWSQILPRPEWLLRKRPDVERSRKRVNSAVAKEVVHKLNGGYFKYPEITIQKPELFLDDNVHLSTMGNNIFLNLLSGGLESIHLGLHNVYPDMLT